jgi:ABC-type glycerol-3-phosphate transport system substrate-binding protein
MARYDKPLKRRSYLGKTAAVAASLGLAGCGGSGDGEGDGEPTQTEGGDDGEPTQIEAWAWAGHVPVLQSLASIFSEQHDKYEAEGIGQPPNNVMPKFVTALQSQQGLPTTTIIRGRGFVRSVGRSGGVEDMSDLMSDYEDQVFPIAKARNFFDGRWFTVPNDCGPCVLYYNRDLFEEAGLSTDPETLEDEIQTIDDYIAVGDTIRSETGAHLTSWDPSSVRLLGQLVMTMAGGFLYNPDGEFQFDQQANVTAYEYLSALNDSDLNKGAQMMSETMFGMLKNEEIATLLAPSWFSNVMKGNASDMAGKWGLMALPRIGDNPRSSNIGGAGAGIPVALSEEQKQAGRDFVEFWHTSDTMYEEKLKGGIVPGLIKEDHSVLDQESEYFGGQKQNQWFIRAAQNVPPQFPEPNPDVRTLHQEATRRIVAEGQDIEQVLQDTNQQMVDSIDNESDLSVDMSIYD